MTWREALRETEIGPLLCILGVLLALAALIAVTAKSTEDSILYMAHGITCGALLVMPCVSTIIYILRQGRIMDRMRARFALALSALEHGERRKAEALLRTIRRLEARWKFGASAAYLLALRAYIIARNLAFGAAHAVLQYHIGAYPKPTHFMDSLEKLAGNPVGISLTVIVAVLLGLSGLKDMVRLDARPWSEFYAVRLAAALRAGKTVEEAPQHCGLALPGDDATARELLGLGQHFTKEQLRSAWLRLARELHPDRWTSAGAGVQRMKEGALKRVNAARDELLPYAV
jgi:hypothetical protein